MARITHKKRLLWIIVAISAVVAITVMLFFLLRPTAQTPNTSSDNLANTPDYGACELITTNVIKSARMGDQITSIREGVRVASDGLNGSAADACKFTFSTNESSNNSLTVAVYPYSTSEESFNKEAGTAQWSEVSGPKPTPYFGTTALNNNQTSVYMLRVIPGAQTILLSLQQPENAKTIQQPDAVNFLVDISNKINFGALESNAAQEAEKQIEGDGPGAPPADMPDVIAEPRE